MLAAYSVPIRTDARVQRALPDETQAYYRVYTRLYLLIDGSRYVWEIAKLLSLRLSDTLTVLREMEKQGIVAEKLRPLPKYRPLPCQPLPYRYYYTHDSTDVLRDFHARFVSRSKVSFYLECWGNLLSWPLSRAVRKVRSVFWHG